MQSQGWGESKPVVVTEEMAKEHAFLKEGQSLDESFVMTLTEQEREIENSVDLNAQKQKRDELVNQGKELKQQYTDIDTEYIKKENEINATKLDVYTKKMEYATLGKQEKSKYNSFKSGKCLTCGHDIEATVIDGYKDKMYEYADLYKRME